MNPSDFFSQALREKPRRWLVTGAAGFVGSHLVEALLNFDQEVCGLDNLSSGRESNLKIIQQSVAPEKWARFHFQKGDVGILDDCRRACAAGTDYVLHQAALCSVPASIKAPLQSHADNTTGQLHLLQVAREAGVKSFVYASSAAVYGDQTELPGKEGRIGNSLSPYALSKRINELHADLYTRLYGISCIGLRYFNLYGPRQNPTGPYASVIPRWIDALLKQEPIIVNGDGTQTRDFCYISNVVQAILTAATTPLPADAPRVFNIANGIETTLLELLQCLREIVQQEAPSLPFPEIQHRAPLAGEVRFSRADISRAQQWLKYQPHFELPQGLRETFQWYSKNK